MNPEPLQTEAFIPVIEGKGLTVTTTVKSGPVQPPAAGVTVYIAVCTELVLFERTSEIEVPVPPEPPVIPPVTAGAFQLKVVPAGTTPFVPLTGVTVNEPSLQAVVFIAVIEGLGLIVSVTLKLGPVHVPEVGVTA